MKPNKSLLQFMLRVQQLADKNATSDKGFAMLVTAVITILLFSLLGAYLTMTDLGKSSASAYVDGSNTFYAAESGLNQRASIVRDRFDGYTVPDGLSPGQVGTAITPAQNITKCFQPKPATEAAVEALWGKDDFMCQQRDFKSNSSSSIRYDRPNSGGNSYIATNQTDTYTAYSFVADTTQYTNDPTTGLPTKSPVPKVVPQGEDYAGLNVIEYKYTVYATAAKKQGSGTQSVANADAKTVLQMDFKSRTIPLFQFAAFYDGDLEITSSSNLNLTGRVHTNGNLYLQPNTPRRSIATVFGDSITTVGRIFRRVDSTLPGPTRGMVKLQTGPTTLNFPPSVFDSTPVPIDLTGPTIDVLSPADSTTFKNRVKDGTSGIVSLTTPPAGFLRKRNYYKSATAVNEVDRKAAVGTYWAKADMRLEMVPDRDAVEPDGITPLLPLSGATAIATGNAWSRNEAIIPFNFTSIQAGAGTGTNLCTTTPPATNTDPVDTYVDPGRNGAIDPSTGAVTIQCIKFNKGQLQSLRQPVMVLTANNQPDTSIDHTDPTIAGSESRTLGKPALPAVAALTSGTTYHDKILRALRVAIASNPLPLPLDFLNVKFSDPTYLTGANAAFKKRFTDLLPSITGLSPTDITALMDLSPNEIAALGKAWFLPAPIQRLTSRKTVDDGKGLDDVAATDAFGTARTNTNVRSSGFYDGREQRWITMLQTDIKSLVVWNRDGLSVEATNEDMRTPYATDDTKIIESFNNIGSAFDTKDKAFVRGAATTETLGLNVDATPNTFASFKRLGLGSNDTTEGGLVFHATVSDDLNGDLVTTDVTRATQDNAGVVTPVSAAITPTTAPIPLQLNPNGTTKFYKNADGTNKLDSSGNPIPYTLDYLRQYWGSNVRQSPFGFAFSSGDFLPGAMTIATDQSVYIQGDFNNNSAPQSAATDPSLILPNPNRLPASILADTITNLSTQCNATSSVKSATNHLGVLAGQIRCGLPRVATGSIDLTELTNPVDPATGNTANFYTATTSVAVNAAYLSYTTRSVGNCAADAGTVPTTYTCLGIQTPLQTSGGLNNYMRMLEDWQETQFFNYSGSFVSLGIPTEYSGPYSGGSGGGGAIGDGLGFAGNAFYNIPVRNFNFDPKFTSFSKLPPLTPQVQYLQQEVFKRTFN